MDLLAKSPPHRTPTALIVEQQRLVVPFLASVLRNAGVHTVVAYGATRTAFARTKPDVVILGMDMSAVRPFELLRRTRRATATARIVVITRCDDPAWNAVAYALGADTILGPSADSRALASAVLAS